MNKAKDKTIYRKVGPFMIEFDLPTWKPIRTAPTDGTIVLCFGEVAGEIHGLYDEKLVYPAQFCGKSDYAGFEWVVPQTDYASMWMKPTHWLPLPAIPETERDEGEKG